MGCKFSLRNVRKCHVIGVFSGIFGCFDVRLISKGIGFSGLRFEALGGPWQKGCQNVLSCSFFEQMHLHGCRYGWWQERLSVPMWGQQRAATAEPLETIVAAKRFAGPRIGVRVADPPQPKRAAGAGGVFRCPAR